MPFTDSDLRALQPQSKKYRVSAGESLFIEVYPNGGRYFVWRHRFPPGKEGKLRDYQIGPYGKGPGQWTLKEARDATGTWIGFVAPRSHGYRPTQCDETRCNRTGLTVVSGSQVCRS